MRALLDSGLAVDTRGWSDFTLLEQPAMHGRTDAVRLLIASGADVADCTFDDDGPTPLDCALGSAQQPGRRRRLPGTVEALLAAGSPAQHTQPTGEPAIDELLTHMIEP